ncbi:hypothetical protein JXL21_12610 [Candidatus Bathyarchaeota archaeon]|nr:hypothetical protein [Candidatus Bathyarchaeota archaeon]
MKENVIRSVELGVAIAACYMAAVTMVQTGLYAKVLQKITGSFIGPILAPYMPYFDIAVIAVALAVCFTFWRKGDVEGFGKLFSLNMLMFFPAVLDSSTFNWVGLIFELTPSVDVSELWVFSVGLLLQVTYLMLRYTVRFREGRDELISRGALEDDINQVSRGQMGYLSLMVALTAAVTAGIYLVAPRLNEYMMAPIGSLPAAIRERVHVLVGIIVILWIAASLILYLRSSSD